MNTNSKGQRGLASLIHAHGLGIGIALAVAAAAVYLCLRIGWPTFDGRSIEFHSAVGDAVAPLATLMSSFALLVGFAALRLQRQDIEVTQKELRASSAAQRASAAAAIAQLEVVAAEQLATFLSSAHQSALRLSAVSREAEERMNILTEQQRAECLDIILPPPPSYSPPHIWEVALKTATVIEEARVEMLKTRATASGYLQNSQELLRQLEAESRTWFAELRGHLKARAEDIEAAAPGDNPPE